jgi:ubiquinol-cytochrome c reductase cytochrome c1 subunit
MQMKVYSKILAIFLFSISQLAYSAEIGIKLDKAPIDPTDKASLQRGLQIYVNNCQACHSLKFTRLSTIAKGIGITDEAGNVLEQIVKDNLLFVGDKITDSMHAAMPPELAASWFGKAPPDLSLEARARGVDWLYTYLRSFYKDSSKPWGVNNLVFPDVGMPHALLGLQGVQEKIDLDGHSVLKLTIPGTLTVAEYDRAVVDLVNFLEYVGEPHKEERKRIGLWVIVFLSIFLVFSYLLKREYWKDIH